MRRMKQKQEKKKEEDEEGTKGRRVLERGGHEIRRDRDLLEGFRLGRVEVEAEFKAVEREDGRVGETSSEGDDPRDLEELCQLSNGRWLTTCASSTEELGVVYHLSFVLFLFVEKARHDSRDHDLKANRR